MRYRGLMDLARKLESAGGAASGIGGDQGKLDANVLWAMAGVYRAKAQELRVVSPATQANLDAGCYDCGRGFGDLKAMAYRGGEIRYFCHYSNGRSCYNDRRGHYFDD